MSFNFLPVEIVLRIFQSLDISDLQSASLVSKKCAEAAAILKVDLLAVVLIGDISEAIEVFSNLISLDCKNWIFKDVEIDLRPSSLFNVMWKHCSRSVHSLILEGINQPEKEILFMLRSCTNLRELTLIRNEYLYMPGTFLSKEEDAKLLKSSLSNVDVLRLICCRHMTDKIFSRLIATVGPLRELCLEGCQISYQSSIYHRFYPNENDLTPSEHVLTFKHILKYIKSKARTLKILNLSQTAIDSECLIELSSVPDLRLEVLLLVDCNQLTKGGIISLAQNQPYLKHLDLSLCSRITDYGVMAITENIKNLRTFNIRRCKSVSHVGIQSIEKLKFLESLDISHVDLPRADSLQNFFEQVSHSSLHSLNIGSLAIQWETVAALSKSAQNLTNLNLSLCQGVTDRSIRAICESLHNLRVLNLGQCKALSDIGLSGCSQDQAVSLPLERDPYYVPIGSKAEQAIRDEINVRKYLEVNKDLFVSPSESRLSHLHRLKKLNLWGCDRITDLTLMFAIRFQELKHINLSYCSLVTEKGLIPMFQNCPSLEFVLLANCGNITDHVVLVLAHTLKRLKGLDLKNCRSLTDDSLDSLSNVSTLRHLDVSNCDKMSMELIRVVKARIPRLDHFFYRGIKDDYGSSSPNRFPSLTPPSPPPLPLLTRLKRMVSN